MLAQQNLGRKEAELREIYDGIREMEWRSGRIDMWFPLGGFRFVDLPKRIAWDEEA